MPWEKLWSNSACPKPKIRAGAVPPGQPVFARFRSHHRDRLLKRPAVLGCCHEGSARRHRPAPVVEEAIAAL